MDDKFFFSLFLRPTLIFFFKFFLLMFIFILRFVFYGLFLSTWCVSSLSGFFSRISSFFFFILLHSLSFLKKLFCICSCFSSNFYNSFIYLFISLLPQIHENLIINMKRAILLATFMLVLHQTKGNAFIISYLFILIPKLW